MIPSSTISTPALSTHGGFPTRPLSANLSSPPFTSLAQRRRNNKNLSLCLSPTDQQQLSSIPPSTPFLSTTSFTSSQQYYQQGPIAILPGLYLGNELNASNVQQLKNRSIQCVINVAAEVEHPYAHLFQPWDQVILNNKTNHSMTTTTVIPCPTLSTSSSSSSSTTSTSSSSSSTLTLSPATATTTTPPPLRTDSVYSSMGYKKRPWHHHILDDQHQASIQKELHAAVMDIVMARQSGRHVLVHCQCGLARSATVVVAYVMYELGLSMSAALHHVKTSAPHINPNLSLMYRLHEYELWLMASHTRPSPAFGSFMKKQKTSASSLVAKCKSFKFHHKSSSSPYACRSSSK